MSALLAYTLPEQKNNICLSYTFDYKEDSWQNKRTGLLWTLSYLGASLPNGSFDKNTKKISEKKVEINFEGLGFNQQALSALRVICDSLKKTPVYRKNQCIDMGHFIALTLGSSWHYYQIIGAPVTYAEFINQKKENSFESLALTKSGVARNERLLHTQFDDSVLDAVFIAEEGTGKAGDSAFVTIEKEVFDIMPNGQLRFMVYDLNGRLSAAGDPQFGSAGKPAKCIWCHEINIQPVFKNENDSTNKMNIESFTRKVQRQNLALEQYRKNLNSDIDFTRLQDHTQMELLYITYMEPALNKLSLEWNIPKKRLLKLLSDQKTHLHHEFSFLGQRYYREQIKTPNHADPGQLPGNIREKSDNEPDFFKITRAQ